MTNDIKDNFAFFYNHKDITYLDNANTTQIYNPCITSLVDVYYNHNFNIGRGIYSGARETQELIERSYDTGAKFLNTSPDNIIFTSGATEGLNMIVYSLCCMFDEIKMPYKPVILTTELEHASCVMPWMAFGQNLVDIKYIKLNEQYSFSIEDLKAAIEQYHPAVLMLASMTNTTGEKRKLKEIGAICKAFDIIFVVDHAQGAAHFPIDVNECNIDFLALSLHKMYGPTGVGLLYAKHLDFLSPMKYGGGMNKYFNLDGTFSLIEGRNRFVAGTPNIADIIGSTAAFELLMENWDEIQIHELELGLYAHKLLNKIPNIEIYSSPLGPIILFNIKGNEALDIANLLDKNNIYIRAGNHCSKLTGPLFGLSTCRISLGIYNTEEDINRIYYKLKEGLN